METSGVEGNPIRRLAPWSCALQLFPERYSCALQLFPDVPHEVHEDHRTASPNIHRIHFSFSGTFKRLWDIALIWELPCLFLRAQMANGVVYWCEAKFPSQDQLLRSPRGYLSRNHNIKLHSDLLSFIFLPMTPSPARFLIEIRVCLGILVFKCVDGLWGVLVLELELALFYIDIE